MKISGRWKVGRFDQLSVTSIGGGEPSKSNEKAV